MKQLVIFLFAVFVAITSCNKDDSDTGTNTAFAEVSLYAAIPDAPELNFSLNGNLVGVDVPYGSYTLYYPVSKEDVNLIAQSSSHNISIDTNFSAVKGGYYSAFLTGTVASVKPYILRDSFPALAGGYCGIRFFIFAPGATGIDLHYKKDSTTTGTGWANRSYVDNISLDTINTFKKFPEGSYTFYAISKTNLKDTLAKLGSKSFGDSANYTLLLEGHIKTGDTALYLGTRQH